MGAGCHIGISSKDNCTITKIGVLVLVTPPLSLIFLLVAGILRGDGSGLLAFGFLLQVVAKVKAETTTLNV